MSAAARGAGAGLRQPRALAQALFGCPPVRPRAAPVSVRWSRITRSPAEGTRNERQTGMGKSVDWMKKAEVDALIVNDTHNNNGAIPLTHSQNPWPLRAADRQSG
jgi:hypothetical protein